MGQFFKIVFATMLGHIMLAILGFFIIVGIIASAGSSKEVKVEKNSVLKLSLSGNVTERSKDNPFEELNLPGLDEAGSTGLKELKETIAAAKEDENIKGIYLDFSGVGAGFATLQEIRDALVDFKKSKKFIVAYNSAYSEGGYYLTSLADEIHLHPEGMIEFNGLSTEVMFLKGAFEKLEVKPEIFKVGDFKSAVEPLFLDKMSDASRLQTTSFLNSIYNYYLKNVSENRGIEYDRMKLISDSMLVRNAKDALSYGLVTHLSYFDEFEASVKSKLGLKDKEKIKYISFNSYKNSSNKKENASSKNRIAVIYAEGNIVDGKGQEDEIGGESLSAQIRKARLDDNIKAVVLRVNSPGGSALASDIIWREVILTKEVKPIIASMSDVAASGGYYISMACDTIVAQPNTITGSIGVFGVMFSLENMLKNKLGITTDRVKTGNFSDVGTMTRTMTDFERSIIQQEVENIYDVFTSKAAKGRNMSQDELKKYASGRVWSGIEAKENGLVDVLGSIDDAIAIAAKKANLGDDYKLKHLPAKKQFFEQLMSKGEENVEMYFAKKHLGDMYQYTQAMKKIKDLEGIQARMPFDITIR
jgi:protease IV